ncbi:MAG: DUF1272 domain-containing protein [Pseudomonadota bacterium]
MLVLKPNCEMCDKDLPPTATDAMICTYECTFCESCVNEHLHNVCPNCGGGFQRRPIRPATAHRPGVSLADHPASAKRISLSYSDEDIAAFTRRLRDVPPAQR